MTRRFPRGGVKESKKSHYGLILLLPPAVLLVGVEFSRQTDMGLAFDGLQKHLPASLQKGVQAAELQACKEHKEHTINTQH